VFTNEFSTSKRFQLFFSFQCQRAGGDFFLTNQQPLAVIFCCV